MPELLFDDQENIDLQNWDEWLDTLVCRCAEEAFKASYTFFGIQGLGQCFSGPNAGSTYNIHGPSDNCVTVGGKPDQDMFVQCDSNVLGKPCVGGNLTNYIYGLSDGMLEKILSVAFFRHIIGNVMKSMTRFTLQGLCKDVLYISTLVVQKIYLYCNDLTNQ